MFLKYTFTFALSPEVPFHPGAPHLLCFRQLPACVPVQPDPSAVQALGRISMTEPGGLCGSAPQAVGFLCLASHLLAAAVSLDTLRKGTGLPPEAGAVCPLWLPAAGQQAKPCLARGNGCLWVGSRSGGITDPVNQPGVAGGPREPESEPRLQRSHGRLPLKGISWWLQALQESHRDFGEGSGQSRGCTCSRKRPHPYDGAGLTLTRLTHIPWHQPEWLFQKFIINTKAP